MREKALPLGGLVEDPDRGEKVIGTLGKAHSPSLFDFREQTFSGQIDPWRYQFFVATEGLSFVL
jgi:hypothetical protein